jgi:ferredoxin
MMIRIRREDCCGNAACVEIAPHVFALDSKNKAVVIDPESVSPETLVEAAEACPCAAILVEDEEGNTLFP